MKILYWDSESNSINEFKSGAESLVDLVRFDEFEEIDHLIDEEDPEAILFDYDANKKQVEKEIKYIKKTFEGIKIILLSNVLTSKQLAKHQGSKVGADIYLRTPMSSKLIASIFSPFFDVDFDISSIEEPKEKPVLRTLVVVEEDESSELMENLEDDAQKLSSEDKAFQEVILKEHTGVETIDSEAQKISDDMDLIFKEAFPETESERQAAIVLADIEKAESEDLFNDIEDISLDDDSMSLSLDADELSDSNSMGEFDPNTQSDETVLPEIDDLAFPDDEDLAFPDDLEASNEVSDTENNKAQGEPDMSGHDESELSLDGMDDLEIGSDTTELDTIPEEEGMELDLSSDDSFDLSSGDSSEGLVAEVDDGSFDLGDSDAGIELGDGSEDAVSIDVVADELELGSEIGDIEETDNASVEIVEDTIDISDGEEESLDLGSDEEESLDFGFDEEEILDLGSDDNSVDVDSIHLETEEEVGISDDELEFGGDDEDSMSSNELPHTPEGIEDNDLSFNTGIDKELSTDKSALSSDAMVKLAEIDAMMMDSEDVVDNEDINITQINDDLIAANSEDETIIADSNDFNLSSETDNSRGVEESVTEETILEPIVESIKSQLIMPEQSEITSSATSEVLRDHQAIKGHHNDELMRLGETIKNLREDREQLLGRVNELEELRGSKERNSVSVKAELDEKKIEISILRKRYVQQIEDMKVQLDISNEKKEILSEKNKQFESEYEHLNRKVRVDFNKVKSRENELEGKLEMLRSDADLQIRNRDQKILELKRKIDTLEFDNESIQTKGQKIVNNKFELEGKMEKVIQTLRSAIGELEDDTSMVRTIKDVKKNLDV